ncbi:hypothetical protein AAFF_G00142280 [Aldrovandia affinis]|uniref:Uncharacterized protein n=1 Tax=Aldrovandia affinis TaxID=143900 RepID=A0AAD7T052_9TELE|nr:hypothetical protein AAFF_G00142280 [Aldrovandia affinis]
MNSHGKCLDTRRLFPGWRVRAVRCSNTERALQLLRRDTLGSPVCIIIHTGINNLRALQQHTATAVKKVAVRATQEFPESRLISTLLPRVDTPPHLIAAVNAEIAKGCATLPSVHLAHHPILGPWHLHNTVLLNRTGVKIFAKGALKDVALGRSPTSPPYPPPSRSQQSRRPPLLPIPSH